MHGSVSGLKLRPPLIDYYLPRRHEVGVADNVLMSVSVRYLSGARYRSGVRYLQMQTPLIFLKWMKLRFSNLANGSSSTLARRGRYVVLRITLFFYIFILYFLNQ